MSGFAGRGFSGSGSANAVSNTAYDATSWDGVTDVAPSKNAVRDKIETITAGGILPVATAESDFIASGASPFAWVKKTLVEVRTILGLDGATTTIAVGGGAGTAPVWTEATGTGAPVRAGSPSFTTQITTPKVLFSKSSDFTGATVDLATATGQCADITTDTTALSTLGATVPAGNFFLLRFMSARTLTYNGTSFILPGARDIVTETGDRAIFESLGSGNWVCHAYMKGNGRVLGDVIISTRPDSATTIAADLMRGQTHVCGYARTYPLPKSQVGMSGLFRATLAVVFSLDPDGTGTADALIVDGTHYAAGEMVSTDGAIYTTLYLECTVANHWDVYTVSGISINGG
jgi:hypothetical protein